MKMSSATAASALAVLVLGAAIAPSASASHTDTRECVSKGEYREVHDGMSVQKVQRIFDQKGVELSREYGYMEKEYFTCTGGSANLVYEHSKKRQTWVLRYKYADFY